MIEQIKKDLRARIQFIQDYGDPMDSVSWEYEEGVLLSGAEALALLEYIEGLEVTEVPFDEVRLHGTYRMNNGDMITITMYDPNEFYCFGGFVDGELYTFSSTGRWSRHLVSESEYSLKAEIQKPG